MQYFAGLIGGSEQQVKVRAASRPEFSLGLTYSVRLVQKKAGWLGLAVRTTEPWVIMTILGISIASKWTVAKA